MSFADGGGPIRRGRTATVRRLLALGAHPVVVTHTSPVGARGPASRSQAPQEQPYRPEYRVWGDYDGRGLVVRSPEPVKVHPTHKTVDVVSVDSLLDAAAHAAVATRTVGVHPGAPQGRAARPVGRARASSAS